MRKVLKIFKWLLLTSIFLLLLGIALGWYFTGTESGYRQLPKLVNKFTPFQISYDELSGSLLHRQQWKNLKVTGKDGFLFTADNFTMDFNSIILLNKQVHFKEITLINSKLHLPLSNSNNIPQKNNTPLERLPEIKLPVQVDIDDLVVNNLTIFSEDVLLITLNKVKTTAHIKDSHVELDVAATITQPIITDGIEATRMVSTNLKGTVDLTNNYPINLIGVATVILPNTPKQEVEFLLTGFALKPQLTIDIDGWIKGAIAMSGAVNLETKTLDIKTYWQNIDFNDATVKIPQGELTLIGKFSDMVLSLKTMANGKDFPKLTLNTAANITSESVKDINLQLDLLGGKISFEGFIDFANTLAWNGVLNIENIDGKHFKPNLDAKLNGKITTEGQQIQGQPLLAKISIHTLDGSWDNQPIQGDGNIYVHNQQIQVNNFLLNFAGNKMAANGNIDTQTADLHFSVDAPMLNNLIPTISGNINGTANISGSPNNPIINSNLQWINLIYTQNAKAVLTSQSGKLTTDGYLEALKVALTTQINGENIPVSNITANMLLSPIDLKDIHLVINTLKGKIAANGIVSFENGINWDIQGKVDNINPQEILSQVNGQIGTDFFVKGRVNAGNVDTHLALVNMRGSWQNQPLNGQMNVDIKGEDITLKDLLLVVGNNHLNAKGDLIGDKVNLTFNIDSKQLATFYPQLKGNLLGKGSISGLLKSPIIKANFQGTNIAFQNNQVGNLKVDVHTGLNIGAPFENHISLSNINVANQTWTKLNFQSNGHFDKHNLSLKTEGGEYNADLVANGGFKSLNSWVGTLTQLAADIQALHWKMKKPTKIDISPKTLRLSEFCLMDQYSDFCISATKEKQTLVDYKIGTIDPKSFKPFIPDNLKISTILKGSGKIMVSEVGKVQGNANLHFTPGEIVVLVDGQPPINLQLKEATLISQFTENTAQSKIDIIFTNVGNIHADVGVDGLKNTPKLHGKLDIDVPDIGKFKYIAPQISEMKGQIKGKLQFMGPVNKPIISGDITMGNGKIIIPEYATELKDIRLKISAQKDGNIGISGNIGTPKGNLTVNGQLRLQPTELDLLLDGQNMLLANSKEMHIIVTPKFDIKIDPKSGIFVNGDVLIPEAKISIPDISSGTAVSDDVVIVNNETPQKKEQIVVDKGTPLKADIKVRLGNKVFFANKDMKIRLAGGINVLVRPGQSVAGKGRIEVAEGVYELYGQELNIKRGWVTFSGNITNPTLDIIALREVDGVEAGAKISGTVQRMRLDLTSNPPMPDSGILSYLIFGRPPDSATDSTALLQTAAVIGTKGIFPDDLAAKTGLDVFDVGIGGLKAGKYLLKDVYVGMKSNFFTQVTTFLARYKITNRLSIEASSSTKDGNAIDALYEFETN